MSMKAEEEEASGTLPSFPWKPEDPSCDTPSGQVCNGFPYYKILTGADFIDLSTGADAPNHDSSISWTEFLLQTPKDCMLAPITSRTEYDTVFAEAKALNTDELNLWLGVTKSTVAAQTDNGGNGSVQNWFNLNGVPAAVTDTNQWL